MNIKSALILLFVSTICLLEVNSKGKVYEDVEDLMKKQAAHQSSTTHLTSTSTIVEPPQLNVHEVTSVNKVANNNPV
jgi:hypothetical protein